MKKILNVLKIFAILLLVVGCGATQSQSVTQQLVGKYVMHDSDGREFSITLDEPESKDDTSGNASFYMGNRKKEYYGVYDVYESSKTVVISYDDGWTKNTTKKLNYDLENNTLTLEQGNGYDVGIYEKQ